MPQYAFFQGIPGDCDRNGQRWFTLDGWMYQVGRVVTGRRKVVVHELVLFIHDLTAATHFAEAVARGRPIKLAEIEVTKVQGGKELRCLLSRVQDVIITSVSRTPPNARVHE
jgi:type VI protein secretion system component Hcp